MNSKADGTSILTGAFMCINQRVNIWLTTEEVMRGFHGQIYASNRVFEWDNTYDGWGLIKPAEYIDTHEFEISPRFVTGVTMGFDQDGVSVQCQAQGFNYEPPTNSAHWYAFCALPPASLP